MTALAFQHYFADQTSLGALDEFGYIDVDSSFYGGLSRSTYDLYDGELTTTTRILGGEYIQNNLVLGVSNLNVVFGYDGESESNSATQLSLGYLINDNLVIKANYWDRGEGLDISAQYSHQLTGNDYIGFTLESNDSLDYLALSSTYFKDLGKDQYLRLNVNAEDILDFEVESLNLSADYYFTAKTSVSIALSGYTEDWTAIAAKHYFNQNVAFYAELANDDEDSVTIGLSGHF